MSNNTNTKTILILAANPTNTARLRLEEEVREIDEGLRRSKKREEFKLEQKWAVRIRDFYRAILDCQPHIVHFCGHGVEEDGIVLEDEIGQPVPVGADTLSQWFEVFAKNGLMCVVLNACYSEVQATSISRHIDYVIGMNRAIGDRAAIDFTRAFYDTLAAGNDVESAFKLGCSLLISLKENTTPVLKKRLKIVTDKLGQNAPETVSQANQNSDLAVVENDFCYDVYISYVDKEPDSSWVWNSLLPRLEQAGLRVAVSGDVEKPGVARIVNIEQGITQSKRTIVVLSEAYLVDNMAEFENVMVQTIGIQEGSYRLIPVKIASIDPNLLPKRLSMLTTLDLLHPYRADREFKRLVKTLQDPLPRF